jgi:hypothetical protein
MMPRSRVVNGVMVVQLRAGIQYFETHRGEIVPRLRHAVLGKFTDGSLRNDGRWWSPSTDDDAWMADSHHGQ